MNKYDKDDKPKAGAGAGAGTTTTATTTTTTTTTAVEYSKYITDAYIRAEGSFAEKAGNVVTDAFPKGEEGFMMVYESKILELLKSENKKKINNITIDDNNTLAQIVNKVYQDNGHELTVMSNKTEEDIMKSYSTPTNGNNVLVRVAERIEKAKQAKIKLFSDKLNEKIISLPEILKIFKN